MTSTLDRSTESTSGRKPILEGRAGAARQVAVYVFIGLPFLALLAAIPFLWGWGLGWLDLALAVGFFYLTGLGVTIGYHRYLTHGAFKATRPMRIALAIAGSMAVQGPPITWVANHRRHHAFADREGDPHSPWLFGTSPSAVLKGFWHAHIGWNFSRDLTNKQRFTPDLLKDRDMVWVNKLFWLWTVLTLLLPAAIGGLVTWSWWGALTAFFWAGLVRVGVLHHVTWSTNSICHMIGDRPFKSRDKAANFWPLAVLSFGESWHNLHHADPTCARHGVRRGQIDTSARLIWLFEKFGWVSNVRWPTPKRVAALTRE
ncbi:acyl-CoA desaturase [Amycolatopsis aidingensis]|uniref:acyl-CoA desaturase n=1 Tax=Amycolatopsis aidingensis TaxID=2842453 RepID=UPI001C0D0CE5|nr:acyl-CoA desaturase [Amycolatopsis aidingensis]